MIKAMPFFYSSPPKAPPKPKGKGKKAVKSSSSSESDVDSVSLESSTEEVQTKGNRQTGEGRRDSAPAGSPLETDRTGSPCSPEEKKQKWLGKKIAHALFDMAGVKSKEKNKEKDLLKEESRPVTADQIRELIKHQKFAEASQHLLLMEKVYNCDPDDKNEEKKMDDQNEMEDLFGLLKQEVLAIIQSSITLALSQPELLQNAIRALTEQVEEDERFGLKEKTCETAVCSHPRNWKEAWRTAVEVSVTKRMTVLPSVGNESISTAAHSFLHMGKTMKEDLVTVVQSIKPHYPDDFQVCSTYAKFYHHCFSSQLEMIAQFELGNQDTYLLLTWVQDIYPNKIRQHPVLEKVLDSTILEGLLPSIQIKQLEATYQANEVDSVKHWLAECLKVEAAKWMQRSEPEKLNGHFHSELPIDVIQVIYGARKRAEAITLELGKQLSALLLIELSAFLQRYKKELDIFIKENKQRRYFEATIIANLNSCLSFRIFTEENATSEQNDTKMKIFTTLDEIQKTGFDVLLQDLFQQIQPLFKTFTQKKWLSCSGIMDEIIAVTSHHVSTFKFLKEPLYQAIMEKIHLHLVQEHITRLLKKKVSLKAAKLQNSLAELIQKNASTLQTFCMQNGSSATWLNSALPSLAEIIKLQDMSAIMFEVGVLVNNYPDISKKHLSALLYIKGTLSSSELRSILSVLDIGVNDTLSSTPLFSKIRAS
ncbi:tumor necrosis factor alpha-induced protein 2 [Pogona vitticeps]